MFLDPSYKIYQTQLAKLRAALVRKLLRPELSREELTDTQGQLHVVHIVDSMPQQIERELQSLLEREEQQRELKEILYAKR